MNRDEMIDRLLDENEIRKCIYRYCRGVDRNDLDLIRSCYHPNAHDDHGLFEGDVDGFIEYIRPAPERYDITQHFVANVLIDVEGDVAVAESYLIAFLWKRTDYGVLKRQVNMRYVDRFEKREGLWKIAERLCVFDWSSQGSSGHEWAALSRPPGPRRDRSDPAYGYPLDAEPVVGMAVLPSWSR